jgi:hypothetical protein
LNREQPDDEFAAKNRRRGQREREKGDERDARHAVSFKTVGGRADGIAGVVAGAIGDDAGIFRIIFGQVENDFHQVGTDVGDFGENAAADAQHARAERFADRKADEARPGEQRRHERKDANHADEFDADEQQADAHAGLQRDEKRFERIALERGERGAGIGRRVDANAKPRDAVAAENSENGTRQNHRDGAEIFFLQDI